MQTPPENPSLTSAPARKALGQHFLFDPDILQRTALAAGSVSGRTVVEIGPGPGGLTRAILDAGAARLIVVEADRRFSQALSNWPEAKSGQLIVVPGDARKVDLVSRLNEHDANLPAMIVANLPYNVATPLLINWLKAGDWRGDMALMFQKEVALRICATPGESHYGRLAVIAQAVTAPHIAFTLPPGAFKPPPKVDSAVVAFTTLLPEQRFDDLANLEALTAAAFGQRRKMLRSSLKRFAKTKGLIVDDWLGSADIDPTARAETIDQAGWRRLAKALTQ